MDQKIISLAASAIRDAQFLLFTAGAGMGVDSGLPDFRGNQGFWKAYPALKGYPFEEMANPQWFESDPTRAWGFYGHRLNLYRETVPHEGFTVMRRWARQCAYFVFTSNVDGQFQRAGVPESHICEVHGSIHHVQRVNPSASERIVSAQGISLTVDVASVRAQEPLPRDEGGHLLRPNVLMYGDWSWLHQRTEAQHVRFNQALGATDPEGVVVVEVGAGTALPTIRRAGERLQAAGATLIRINPRESHGPRGTLSIPGGGKEGLMAIDAILEEL